MTTMWDARSQVRENDPIPANVEAEESLLGSMLISRGAIDAAIAAGVTRKSFHQPINGIIYEHILEAAAIGGVDVVTVSAALSSALGDVISTHRLIEIQAATPASSNAPAYAALVVDAARRREVMALAYELHEAARDGADTSGIVASVTAVAARASCSRMVDGRTFVLDAPSTVPTIWGAGDAVLWAQGESLEIVGPTGVGKTTLAVELVAGRLGILDRVLGMEVAPAKRVLYLACDRAAQIRRVFARLIGPEHADVLADRLRVWQGPPARDFAKHPDTLAALARDVGADCVFIDSLKDVALGLADDEVGAGLNIAIQTALADGVEVCPLHHQRKGQGGQRPRTLEDVYGSTWITAGAGSVVLLWGEAGAPIVDLIHLKQPAEPVGPLRIDHDHITGISTVTRGQADPYVMLQHAPNGLTARDVARVTTEKADPSENDVRVARRRLDKLVGRGAAHRTEPTLGGAAGTQPARYFAVVADVAADNAISVMGRGTTADEGVASRVDGRCHGGES